jgi:hypothetical protein
MSVAAGIKLGPYEIIVPLGDAVHTVAIFGGYVVLSSFLQPVRQAA